MASLKDRFTEIIHMDWDEFIELEKSGDATVDDEVLCSLVRACADTDDISAIKLAFDRIEGLQETPIEVKIPKFYTRFINAKKIESSKDSKTLTEPSESSKKDKKGEYDPATAKLRETLQEMRSMPRQVIRAVRMYKHNIEDNRPVEHHPKVKSVICANLLNNVTKGKFKAVELVFDQIDGKLTKTITLLGGNDVYIDDYVTLTAPAHAKLDDEGVYYAENEAMTTAWIRGFAHNQKGLEMLLDEVDDE